MRNRGILSFFVALILILTGCSFTIGGGTQHTVWEGASQAEQVTIAEINAAAGLMLESNREKTLKSIAMRPGLSADTQVYLVQVAVEKLLLEDSRRSVMLALVNNPALVAEGKIAVLEHLDDLMLESSRRQVQDCLNRRGNLPTGKEMEAITAPRTQTNQPIQMETTVEMTYSTGL